MGYIWFALDRPPITVIETPEFVADAKRVLGDAERWNLINAVSADPERGALMVGSGGARKLRWATRGKGKSGGFRVVYHFHGYDVPVFMLGIFAKGEKINLTKAELNELAGILSGLADDYREGVKRHVQSRRKAPPRR